MKTSADIAAMLNNWGLAQSLTNFGQTLLTRVAAQVNGVTNNRVLDDPIALLNSVGPAAMGSAIEACLAHCVQNGYFKSIPLTNNHAANLKLIQNDQEGFRTFGDTVRQFLLPRYAFYNLDSMVDPRHDVSGECGYPRYITPIMYRMMVERDDVASRVNNIYPDETFSMDPEVWEDEDETKDTGFEEDYKNLCEDYNLIQLFHRVDRLCGIGHYGGLLFGLDDTDDLEKPIEEPDLLTYVPRARAKKERKIKWLRPFDEYLSYVTQFDTDTSSPRCGQPIMYNLVFVDMSIDAAGASIGTRIMRRVHWTRFVHVTDDLYTSPTFHKPRLEAVFDRLLDLRKGKGSSAEALWKGGFPGLNFKVDPHLVADKPDFDEEAWREEIQNYLSGLDRSIRSLGIEVSAINTQIADPTPFVLVQLQAIAAEKGIPFPIFMGAEEGQLASVENKLSWNRRLGRRFKTSVGPSNIRRILDRLIAVGAMRPPEKNKGRYNVGMGDLNTVTDEDKANLALKWTQALSQYVASGVVHLIDIIDYLTLIVGLRPSEAVRIAEYCKSQGGLEKLKAVDPAKGGGQNGVMQDQAGGSKSEPTNPANRTTADRQADGMKG